MNQDEIFFEAGVDGGGECLYRRQDGSFYTKGSSGGFLLDEEEDPRISWTKEYADFETYFEEFMSKNGSFWICFFPLHIHPDAFSVVKEALSKIEADGDSFDPERSRNWLERMETGSRM